MIRYIKIENDLPKDYTLNELFTDYPNAIIYKNSKMPNEHLLSKYNVYPLITTEPPIGDVVEEGIPVFKDNEWIQTWTVRKLTPNQIKSIIDNSKIENTPVESTTVLEDIKMQKLRYRICKMCDAFTGLKTCKVCNSIMPLKTKVKDASCPLGKW